MIVIVRRLVVPMKGGKEGSVLDGKAESVSVDCRKEPAAAAEVPVLGWFPRKANTMLTYKQLATQYSES